MKRWSAFLALLCVTAPGCASRQSTGATDGPEPQGGRRPTLVAGQPAAPGAMPGTPHYDVVLEVPELTVEELELRVAGVLAHLSLDAMAANLVAISAGAEVGIDRVELDLYGILTEAYLYIDLDNVGHIVRRVVKTLDHNPRILARLLQTADSLVRTVGTVANTALQPDGVVSQTVSTVGRTLHNVSQPGGLLSQTANTLGQTVQHLVTQTGTILERTLDTTGRVVNERTLGNVLTLPLVSELTNTLGQTVRTLTDTTGNLIEVTLDGAGNVLGTRVLQRGGAGVNRQQAGAAPSVPPVGGILGGQGGPNTPGLAGLLSQTLNSLGQSVRQLVTPNGSLIERVLDTTGKVLNEKTVGSVLDLRVLERVVNLQGFTVCKAAGPAGGVIEYTLDQAGNVMNARVLEGVPVR